MNFHEIIQNIMECSELSQTELAKTLGVSQRIVSDWIHEKALPSYYSILSIYTAFGVTPNELYGIEDYLGIRSFNK